MPDHITKFLRSLDANVRRKLKAKILLVKKDPFTMRDVKKSRGFPADLYRLRVGKIRIIYRVRHGEVDIVDIDYRGNIY